MSILTRLVEASLQMTAAFVLVWLLCTFVSKLSADARCWLWRLVLLKGAVSLVWVWRVPILDASDPLPSAEEPLPLLGMKPAEPTALASTNLVPDAGLHWPAVAVWVWLTAVGVALTWMALMALQSRRLRRGCSPLLVSLIAELTAKLGLRKAPRVQSGNVESAMVTGLVSPKIIVPQSLAENEHALAPALAHEMAHVKRLDLWWDLFAALARAVFWFHPLAWIAASRARVEAEIACDSIAITVTEQSPRAYGSMLVNLSGRRAVGYGLSLSFDSSNTLKRRLSAMAKDIPTRRSVRKALLICALPALLALVPWKIVEAQAGGSQPATRMPVQLQRGYKTYFSSGAHLVGDRLVRNELRLTSEQIKLLDEASETANVEMRELGNRIALMKQRKMSVQERVEYENREKPLIYERHAAKIFRILTPAQEQRLAELHLQHLGEAAIRLDDVATKVGISKSVQMKVEALHRAHLQQSKERERQVDSEHFGKYRVEVRPHTAAEKKRIASLRKRYVKATGDLQDQLWKQIMEIENRARRQKPISQDEWHKMGREWRDQRQMLQHKDAEAKLQIEEKIRQLLSPEQRRKWEQMIGRRIEFAGLGTWHQFVWDGTKYVKEK